jgi:hypothetical protein
MQQEHDIWKYAYWLDDTRFQEVQQEMAAKGVHMRRAEKNPCETLLDDVGYAAPECWSAICRFDALPWFEASPFKNKTLVVSSTRLGPAYDDCLETTITPITFNPKSMPDKAERDALINAPEFVKRKPAAWNDFPQEMGEQIVKGLARMSGKPAGTWDELFQTWTSVHANFVAPQFRSSDAQAAPYSIGDTFSISSCCVELFNLLDSTEAVLLVRPCTGAALLQAMERDRYYLVRLVKNAERAIA